MKRGKLNHSTSLEQNENEAPHNTTVPASVYKQPWAKRNNSGNQIR
ncbi:hypothetical protein A33Q_0145 [Indibacter alkaliphilus LW1]|uniref:Uncharacterized protein n=1 Tax=Indibacter alkaliphilus (strain CCUG 57479 / KCTC 22604 / LW1) TaxID=1189612 RepID=S2ED09_INDAL|nr:hypothetical protein A33Q_0145 [Indibacter alkaliphilus LW1]